MLVKMKKIKPIVTLLFVAILLVIASSCKKGANFLDKAPGVSVDENTLFSSRVQLDQFLATIYKNAMPALYNYQDFSLTTTTAFNQNDATTPAHGTESICDEGKASEASFIQTNNWNSGDVSAANITSREDRRYYQRWIALREIALMLKRVDEVPDADAAYKAQVKGEVKVLRALDYLEMVKRYGGVPIVNQVFDAGANINALVPRASIADTFSFIVKDCDEALPSLPATYSASLTGRVTSLAALAVKAKALLYAASPLYNTATPYMDFGANNKLICYTNSDVNRWKLAADAAKAVLDAAPASGVALIDVPANRNPATPPVGSLTPVVGNYSNAWEAPNNSEIILAFQGYLSRDLNNPPLKFISPQFTGPGWSGVTVPLNFFSKYEKLDGTPQTWSASGGTDLIAMYNQLDPRFKQTMCYTNSYWNPVNTIVPIYAGGLPAIVYTNCLGGIWMHKLIPRAATTSISTTVNDITFSIHEFYLDYAEALNEFSGPSIAAYSAVNAIRNRSGMPDFPNTLTQSTFRDKLRNERAIELAYEEHRFWDIKRWMIAENDGVMQGAMRGLKITKVGNNFTWVPYTFETRVWLRQEYMHPFPLSEVLKGGLIQNPGW